MWDILRDIGIVLALWLMAGALVAAVHHTLRSQARTNREGTEFYDRMGYDWTGPYVGPSARAHFAAWETELKDSSDS